MYYYDMTDNLLSSNQRALDGQSKWQTDDFPRLYKKFLVFTESINQFFLNTQINRVRISSPGRPDLTCTGLFLRRCVELPTTDEQKGPSTMEMSGTPCGPNGHGSEPTGLGNRDMRYRESSKGAKPGESNVCMWTARQRGRHRIPPKHLLHLLGIGE